MSWYCQLEMFPVLVLVQVLVLVLIPVLVLVLVLFLVLTLDRGVLESWHDRSESSPDSSLSLLTDVGPETRV